MSLANPAALSFLQYRQSYPAKMMTGPGPTRVEMAPILTAALRVPDHGGLQPWRILAMDRAALTRLADQAEAHARSIGMEAEPVAKARGQFDRSPFALAVVFSPKESPKVPMVEQMYSAGALCLGILNAAQAAGWGACWLSGWISQDAVFVQSALGLSPAESLAGFIHIGRETTPVSDRTRPSLDKIVTWLTA